jgi:uncharacterized protein (DUF2237 family)
MFKPLNVFGEPLRQCSVNPMTGFYRDGSCNSGIENQAWHMICIQATQEFLDYSKEVGNDLSTPLPQYGFEGIKAGDSWCLAVGNFMKALKYGKAPKIFLHSTHQAILDIIDLETLKKYALDLESSDS